MTTATIIRPAEPAVRAAPARPRLARAAGGGTGRSGHPRPVGCEQSYAADLHGSRLTRRGRLVVAGVWLLLATAAAVGVLRPQFTATAAPSQTATVVVEPGDTLWGLAAAAGGSVDPRVTVGAIIDLNDLRSGGDIHPGDVLLVPAHR